MTTKLNSLPPEYKSKISAISLPYSPSNTVLPLVRRLLFCWPKTFLISSSTNINTNRRPLAFEIYSRRFLFFFFRTFSWVLLAFFRHKPNWHLALALNSTELNKFTHPLGCIYSFFSNLFSFSLSGFCHITSVSCSFVHTFACQLRSFGVFIFFFFNKTVNIWCRLRNYGLWKVSVSF